MALSVSPDPSPTWVVWHYDEALWTQWDAREWTTVQRHCGRNVLIATAAGLSLGILLVLVIPPTPVWWGQVLFILVWGLVTASGAAVGQAGPYLESLNRHQARLRGPREIRIAARGFYEADHYVPLIADANLLFGASRRLLEVSLVDIGASRLRFHIGEWGTRSNRTFDLDIPIPPDQEVAARNLVKQFDKALS